MSYPSRMTPGAERNYWAAVNALREAETLAQLAGSVSGPADEPPRDGEEQSWIADWTKRAKESLAKAREWRDSEKKSLRDRAARIARHASEGVRRIGQAAKWQSPGGVALEGAKWLKTAAGKKVMRELSSVSDTARSIQFGVILSSVGATVALLALGWWALSKRKET